MPLRYSHHFVLALIALTVLAFWPGYFSVLPTAPWGFHFHGITATLWMLTLAAQSWSIHDRRNALHKQIGLFSLALFPLFLAGGAAVDWSMAKGTRDGDLFYQMYGTRLGTMDTLSLVLLCWLFYNALKHRRTVQLHARYVLATPLPLLMPIFGRAINHLVPALMIHGPQDFPNFAWGTRIASVLAVGVAAWLYSTAPRYGRPFLIGGAAVALQQILFETLGYSAAWRTMFLAFAAVPLPVVIVGAMAVGAAVTWAGWIAGMKPARRIATA